MSFTTTSEDWSECVCVCVCVFEGRGGLKEAERGYILSISPDCLTQTTTYTHMCVYCSVWWDHVSSVWWDHVMVSVL